jgi:hypothetical protein
MSSSTGVQGTSTVKSSRLPRCKLVSGETIEVLSPQEKRWFDRTREEYLDQTKFSETTDLRDVDRLLVHELLIYRWTTWIASGTDYDGHLIDEQDLQRNIKLYSSAVTDIKESMGLTKKARDAAADKGTLADYIANLKQRAKVFGVHREKQLVKALSLFEELSTVVGSFLRSDAEERAKLGFESEAEIVDWIANTMLPEYRAIDEHFRQNEQRYWVKDV